MENQLYAAEWWFFATQESQNGPDLLCKYNPKGWSYLEAGSHSVTFQVLIRNHKLNMFQVQTTTISASFFQALHPECSLSASP